MQIKYNFCNEASIQDNVWQGKKCLFLTWNQMLN